MDSGIFSFCQIASFNKIAVDAKRIIHEFSDGDIDLDETSLLQAIRSNGFHAKAVDLNLHQIDSRVLPIILQSNDGEYFVLAGIRNDEFLTIRSKDMKIIAMSKSEIEVFYSNRAILIT